MSTPQSPFAALQALQEEQREGWAPAPKDVHIAGLTNDLMTVRDSLKAHLAEKDAKIAEQAAQIVALRGCLEHLQRKDWFIDQYYPYDVVMCGLSPSKVRAALSTPAPPVVPLEDVRPLVDQFQALLKSALPHPVAHPSMHTAWSTANAALLLFTTSHPQP